MSRRSSPMSNKCNSGRNWREGEGEENNQLAKNPYYKEYNYGYTPGKYDIFSSIDSLDKKGYNLKLTQSRIDHPDGRVEYQSSINLSKNKPREIVNSFTQNKRELVKDFDVINQTKSYKTGIIFKDTHYYETQKVVPKSYYVNYERTVDQYDDGTKNYGDWRQIK
jgi:hypothetical protein